jgi:uncharacterized protein YndB with AHSA1/START domain
MISTTTVTFHAPIEKVWQGLTDPAMVKQYFFGTELKSDFKAGSRITFSGEWNGQKYEDSGDILEIDAPRLLKYSYWSSMSGTENKPENYNDITYRLSEGDGVTTLVITQECVKNEAAAEHSESNWMSVVEGLKKMIE